MLGHHEVRSGAAPGSGRGMLSGEDPDEKWSAGADDGPEPEPGPLELSLEGSTESGTYPTCQKPTWTCPGRDGSRSRAGTVPGIP
jgi:hypothetical protein